MAVKLENAGAIQLLSENRKTKIMIQAEKFKYLPNHPMKQGMHYLTKIRLKHSSFRDISESIKPIC